MPFHDSCQQIKNIKALKAAKIFFNISEKMKKEEKSRHVYLENSH